MYSRVYVEITNICNMNCSFCHGHSRVPGQMTVDKFSFVLDKLQGYTKYIYYHLMGEPLTHPSFCDFLKIADSKGYKSVITTNGTLLNKKGKYIIGQKVHKVSISVHSFEGHDEERYRKYLDDIINFAVEAVEAEIIVVLRFWNKGFDGGLNDKAIGYLKEHIDGDWMNNTKGIRIKERFYIEWGERFEWPDINAPLRGEKYFCYGLKDHFGILCDGTVVPCCLDSDGVINLGNIFTDDITEILSSERAEAMVKGFNNRIATEELCKRCGYAQRFV